MRAAPPLADDAGSRERTRSASLSRFKASPVAAEATDDEPDPEPEAADDDLNLDDLLDEPDPDDTSSVPSRYRLTLLLGPDERGKVTDIRSPVLPDLDEARAQLEAVRPAQRAGELLALPWVTVSGSKVLAASYWDERPSGARFAGPVRPRIRVLVDAGEGRELLGPTLRSEEDARREIGAVRSLQREGGLAELPWLSVDASRIVASHYTDGPDREHGRFPL